MKFFLVAYFFCISVLQAKTFPLLDKVLSSYVKSSGLKILLLKKENSILFETKSQSKAYLYIKHKKLKLDYLPPKKLHIFFNKKDLWVVSKNFIKYTDKKAVWSQIPLVQLFSLNLDLKNYFSIRWKEDKLNIRTYTLKARLSDLREKIKKFKIIINKKTKKVLKISYQDDLENTIEYQFLKTQFNQKLKNSFFNFKPKKKSKIIVL